MLVSDDVERECLKTSNKGSGSHTWEKGGSHTAICTQGIFAGGGKKIRVKRGVRGTFLWLVVVILTLSIIAWKFLICPWHLVVLTPETRLPSPAVILHK